MDQLLIEKFRNRINETEYAWKTFSNVKGRNQWNCICSAMDWITVAVNGIDFMHGMSGIRHGSEKTFDVLTLIMRIALIKEGIEQLHRVLYGTSEQYRKDDKIVWNGDPFGQTDNEYFEILRACFGAHPINLKGLTNSNMRQFASWPFMGTNGFSVFLYPSNSEEENLILSISFEQLEKYALLRYQHLTDMIQIIEQGNLCVRRMREVETSI